MSPVDSPAGSAVLSWHDLSVCRGDGFGVGVDELSLADRQVAALVGSSGCGKTTLLWGMFGLLPGVGVGGALQVLGRSWPDADTAEWRQMLAGPVTIVMQDAQAALDPLQRIGAQIQDIAGCEAPAVLAALARLGLQQPERIAAAWPHQVSGGQAQKVLLAIALLRAPRLLVLDEPTANLDGVSIADLVANLDLLREQHHTAILLATHDMDLVAALDAQLFQHRDGWFRHCEAVAAVPARADLAAPGGPVLQVRGVTKSYGRQGILRGIDFALHRGEVVAVVGPSGCGKTTLARILVGDLAADAGQIEGAGAAQLLSQDAYASLTPGRRIAAMLRETAVADFDQLAEAVALGLDSAVLQQTAAQLSGGERRRVALLRALSVRPQILILDEPTASLDRASAVAVMKQLMNVQRQHQLAVLWITHDAELADGFAHRVLHMTDGRFA